MAPASRTSRGDEDPSMPQNWYIDEDVRPLALKFRISAERFPYASSPKIFTTPLQCTYCYYVHFKDDKTEASRDYVLCSRSHTASKWQAWDLNTGHSDFKASCPL